MRQRMGSSQHRQHRGARQREDQPCRLATDRASHPVGEEACRQRAGGADRVRRRDVSEQRTGQPDEADHGAELPAGGRARSHGEKAGDPRRTDDGEAGQRD